MALCLHVGCAFFKFRNFFILYLFFYLKKNASLFFTALFFSLLCLAGWLAGWLVGSCLISPFRS